MRMPPSVLDDLAHCTAILKTDSNPNWHMGAAGMLRNLANDIDRAAEVEKANMAHDAARKENELSSGGRVTADLKSGPRQAQ